jgi:hypothetical protein
MFKEELTAELRNLMIRVMAKRKGAWTVEDLAARMKKTATKTSKLHGNFTSNMLGNNLRVLKKSGVVTDQKDQGVRVWTLLDPDHHEEAPVKMVISFPKATHEALSQTAEDEKATKNQVVVDAVQLHLGL